MSLTFTLFEFGGALLLDEGGAPVLDEGGGYIYADGAPNDITADVRVDAGVTFQRGMSDTGVTERVAGTGTLTFMLENSAANSVGVPGLYSPDTLARKPGWELGTRVQLVVTDGSLTRYRFLGKVHAITPESGVFGGRGVQVTCTDYMDYIANQKLRRLPVQTNIAGDALVDYLVQTLPIQPRNTNYAVGVFTFATALDTEQDERTTALNAIAKVCASDLSYFFVRGNTTDGETLTLESRDTRASRFAISAQFTDTMTGLELERTTEKIINAVRLATNPRRVDAAATTVIASLDREITIAAGATETITLRYTDPNGAGTRISAIDHVTPTGADLVFTSGAGGTGSDLAGSLSITPTWGGNAAEFVLTNASGSTGYLSVFRARGRGIYLYNPSESYADDEDSQQQFGLRPLDYTMPYIDSPIYGQAYADEIKTQYANPYSDLRRVTFDSAQSATLQGYAVTLDIGDRVSVRETQTGVDDDFFVQRIEQTISLGRAETTLLLVPVRTGADIFILDSSTNGLLDVNRLG